MPTDFAALDALYPLPPDELWRQWVLTRDAALPPAGWEQRTVRGWHLAFHPDAFVCDLKSTDGTTIGWVLQPTAYLAPDGDVLPDAEVRLPIGAGASPADVERALYGRDERGQSSGDGFDGHWVAVVFAGPPDAPTARVYLGPTNSVVYSAEHGAVATTHNLIPGLRRDEQISRAFDPLATNGYVCLGFTSFHGLRRLLPNHYLDLETFAVVRHWPPAPLELLPDGPAGAAAIVEHARRLLDLLATEHRVFRVFLSAGRDSRAVLAMARPLIGRPGISLHLATTAAFNPDSLTDLQGARRLARIAKLPHEISWRQNHVAERPEVMRSFVRIGEAYSGTGLSKPAIQTAPKRSPHYSLAGMGAETGRAARWTGRYDLPDRVTPEMVVARSDAPVLPPLVEAAEAWLAGLPLGYADSPADLLDLMRVEQRLACWEAPARYVFPGIGRSTSSPMIMTFNIETMLRLPLAYRASHVLQQDMTLYGWPELMAVPVNEATGALRLLRPTLRLARKARGRYQGVRRRAVNVVRRLRGQPGPAPEVRQGPGSGAA